MARCHGDISIFRNDVEPSLQANEVTPGFVAFAPKFKQRFSAVARPRHGFGSRIGRMAPTTPNHSSPAPKTSTPVEQCAPPSWIRLAKPAYAPHHSTPLLPRPQTSQPDGAMSPR